MAGELEKSKSKIKNRGGGGQVGGADWGGGRG